MQSVLKKQYNHQNLKTKRTQNVQVAFKIEKYPHYKIVVYDKLTYAGNPENLRDVEDDERYRFVHGDIRDRETVVDLSRP